MKRVLLVCLLALVFPAAAQAHFTTQGYMEIVQDGKTVDYALGLEDEALSILADGREQATIAAYVLPRVRVSSAGEPCTGKLNGWTRQQHAGEAYLRLALEYECASESGPFAVRYSVPSESMARFELGGQEGTFLFD